jgi:hypothetical protein
MCKKDRPCASQPKAQQEYKKSYPGIQYMTGKSPQAKSSKKHIGLTDRRRIGDVNVIFM